MRLTNSHEGFADGLQSTSRVRYSIRFPVMRVNAICHNIFRPAADTTAQTKIPMTPAVTSPDFTSADTTGKVSSLYLGARQYLGQGYLQRPFPLSGADAARVNRRGYDPREGLLSS